MYTHRVNVLDKADCDHVAVLITNNFKLKLFPAADTFLNKNLSYKAGLKTSCTYCLKLFLIIYKTTTGTAHGISRSENYRISELVSNRKCFVNRVSNLTSCNFDTKRVHGVLKLYTVLTTLDGINLNTDNLYIVLVKNSCFSEL